MECSTSPFGSFISINNLNLLYVLDTHIHADHISGMSMLNEHFACEMLMGRETLAEGLTRKLDNNEEFNLGDLTVRTLFTPGHTSDSFCFLMNKYLFSGDTLLINGTGRTDFQNGNSTDAYNSIFNRLLKLPEDTLLYPAHDYKGETVSTIGKEKRSNPRLQVRNVDEYIEIMNNLNLKKPEKIDYNVSSNLKLGV